MDFYNYALSFKNWISVIIWVLVIFSDCITIKSIRISGEEIISQTNFQKHTRLIHMLLRWGTKKKHYWESMAKMMVYDLWLSFITCRARGFHLIFFSKAGAEVSMLWGRFFKVKITPLGSSRSAFTKFFNCHPTW